MIYVIIILKQLKKNLKIKHDMVNNYYYGVVGKYNIKDGGVKKTIPSFGDKSKYVLYYKSLQLYSSVGMRLVGILVLELKQLESLRKYIDFNTNKKESR